MPKISELTAAAARVGDEQVAVASSAGSRRLVLREQMHNVLDYGAKGSNAHTTSTSTVDDTSAIQAAIDAAGASAEEAAKTDAANGTGTVFFPGNRTYLITSTIKVPTGVRLIGGAGTGNGNPDRARITWRGPVGAAGDPTSTMMEVRVSDTTANIGGVYVEHLNFDGGYDSNRLSAGANHNWVFRRDTNQASGKIDTGVHFVDVQGGYTRDNAFHFMVPGMTNFAWNRGRIDQCGGYGIYVQTWRSNAFMVVSDMTYDNWVGDNPDRSKGFLFLDGQAGEGHGQSFVSLRSLHLEVNGSLVQTYLPTGWTPKAEDTRGVIRLGVNTSSNNVRQHNINFDNLWIPSPASTAPYSCFQVTSADPTADNRSRHSVAVAVSGQQYSGPTSILGGVHDTHAFPYSVQSGAAATHQIATMDYHPVDNPANVNVPANTRKVSWQRGISIAGQRQRTVISTRVASDVVVTNGSTTCTSSNSARFQSSDVGAAVSGTNIPTGATITAVTDRNTATLSAAATGLGTTSLTIVPPASRLVAGRDHGTVIESEKPDALSIVLPVLFEGFELEVYQQGSGTVSFTAATGVTLRSNASLSQFASKRIRYRTKSEVVLS